MRAFPKYVSEIFIKLTVIKGLEKTGVKHPTDLLYASPIHFQYKGRGLTIYTEAFAEEVMKLLRKRTFDAYFLSDGLMSDDGRIRDMQKEMIRAIVGKDKENVPPMYDIASFPPREEIGKYFSESLGKNSKAIVEKILELV